MERLCNVIIFIALIGLVCSIAFGCISQQKQDIILEAYSNVVKEYININTEYIKLLEWVKTKNLENNEVIAELDKAIEEAKDSKTSVGILSVDIENSIKSSTLDEEKKTMFLEILDMVLPDKDTE